jgi:hypothetical protein
MQHQPFGELVDCEHYQRERGDPAVRFLKNGIGGGHGKFTRTSLAEFPDKTIKNPHPSPFLATPSL